MNIFRYIAPALFAIGFTARAVDVPFSYTFTASNLGGPLSTISGSFSGIYTPIDGFGSNASTLTSINLNIAGFSYTTGNTILEVSSGLWNPIPISGGYKFFSIYGVANGTGGAGFINDFRLAFVADDDGTINPWMFYYATPGSSLFFDEDANIGTYSITSIRNASVADRGSSLILLCLGVLSVSAISRLICRNRWTGGKT